MLGKMLTLGKTAMAGSLMAIMFAACSVDPKPREKVATPAAEQRPALASDIPLEVQERCEVDAEKWFKESGLQKVSTSWYFSHFSKLLNRCLVASGTFSVEKDRSYYVGRSIADANEGRNLAEYSAMSDRKSGPVFQENPIQCYFLRPDGKKSLCSSGEEYDAAAETLMDWQEIQHRTIVPAPPKN